MILKQKNAGLLSNFEVMDLLRSRGADQDDLATFGSASPSECKVYEYLKLSPAGTQTRDSLHVLLKKLDQYKLTKAERLQVLNLRPSTDVEIHMIVEDCEERMSDDVIDEFIGIVDSLPQPPEKPTDDFEEEEEAEGEDNEVEENGDNDEADEQ